MKNLVKQLIFILCKYTFLMSFARYYTKDKLRIMFYHGISMYSEHKVFPELFISSETFEKRLKYLLKNFTVQGSTNTLRGNYEINRSKPPVLITFDDGFNNNYTELLPIIEKYKIFVVIYVSTWYVEKQIPIFNLVVDYCFAKTKLKEINSDLRGVKFNYNIIKEKSLLLARKDMIEYFSSLPDCKAMIDYQLEVMEYFGLELSAISLIRDKKIFHLMNENELQTIASSRYVSIQLHTHTHKHLRYLDRNQIVREINKNRKILKRFTNEDLTHLAYPKGLYSKHHEKTLSELGIDSAVTTIAGLNDKLKRENRYEILRISDSQNKSNLQFKFELSGCRFLYDQIIRSYRKYSIFSWL